MKLFDTFDAEIKENEKIMRKDMMVQAAEMLDAAGFKNFPIRQGIFDSIHEMGRQNGKTPKPLFSTRTTNFMQYPMFMSPMVRE